MSEVSASRLKEEGNEAYRCGLHEEAIARFSDAIKLDPKNETLFCNRSMCYAALRDWSKSAADAKESIALSQKYVKAHYRLVKAQLELSSYKDARLNLLYAIHLCGDCKELKMLEAEILLKTKIPLRPKSTDFEVIEDLGEGNFSKIFKVSLKSTGEIYAMKVIDKANAKKMERRHKNINNEIMMEKRVLNKLNHPNIVVMFGTFQDEGSLYYHMEFCAGGELWGLTREKDSKSGLYSMVGIHLSLLQFYVAELINALEFMHKKGIAHRDIKPENILLTANGHVKIIDFGTAKDLIETDLNGPDFVGTSEYMSPSTVNGKPTGIEGDLWALGVVIFQCITGYTTFHAASPYLVFLLIKRALVRYPTYVPTEINNLLKLLLEKNGPKRLQNALGPADLAGSNVSTGISYDYLRGHEFFQVGGSHGDGGDMLRTVEGVRAAFTRTAVRVPLLSEISLRAVGSACVHLSELVALNGGVRPDVPWMQSFDLKRLSESQRGRVAHYLNRRHRLHVPGTHRLFYTSAVTARCNRVDNTTLEYMGHGRDAQGLWDKPFFFAYLCDPLFGHHSSTSRNQGLGSGPEHGAGVVAVTPVTATAPAASAATPSTPSSSNQSTVSAPVPAPTPTSGALSSSAGVCDVDQEMETLRTAISAINKLRPRFVVVTGSFTHAYPSTASPSSPSSSTTQSTASYSTTPTSSIPALSSTTPSSTTPSSTTPSSTPSAIQVNVQAAETLRDLQLNQFMRTMARVSETIPLLFVPGDRDVGEVPTPASLAAYRKLFGRDHYGFWYGGVRCLVVNSPLLIHPEGAPADALFQREWLEEEIEQAKLSSTHVMIFTAHPWFLKLVLQDGVEGQGVGTGEGAGVEGEGEQGQGSEDDVSSDDLKSVRTVSLPDRLHWLKRLRHSKVKFLFSGGGYCESPVQGPHTQPVAGLTGSGGVREGKTTAFEGACPGDNSVQGRQHVRELCVCNSVCAVNKGAEGKRRPFPKALFPPPPEKVDGDDDEETEEAKKKRMKELKKSVRQELKRGLAGVKTDEVEYGNYDDELSEEEEEEDVEEEWTNQDETCEGPLMIITSPLGVREEADLGPDPLQGQGVRIIKVYEQEVFQEFFTVGNIPKTVTL